MIIWECEQLHWCVNHCVGAWVLSLVVQGIQNQVQNIHLYVCISVRMCTQADTLQIEEYIWVYDIFSEISSRMCSVTTLNASYSIASVVWHNIYPCTECNDIKNVTSKCAWKLINLIYCMIVSLFNMDFKHIASRVCYDGTGYVTLVMTQYICIRLIQ